MVLEDMIIQKVSDGDKLDTMDISKLRSGKTDIVVLTCMDALVPKEEDLFLDDDELFFVSEDFFEEDEEEDLLLESEEDFSIFSHFFSTQR